MQSADVIEALKDSGVTKLPVKQGQCINLAKYGKKMVAVWNSKVEECEQHGISIDSMSIAPPSKPRKQEPKVPTFDVACDIVAKLPPEDLERLRDFLKVA